MRPFCQILTVIGKDPLWRLLGLGCLRIWDLSDLKSLDLFLFRLPTLSCF